MTNQDLIEAIAEARQLINTQAAVIEGQKVYIEVLEAQLDKLHTGIGKARLLADMLADAAMLNKQAG